MNNYYLLTHTRAAPWLIGVILGYMVATMKASKDGMKIGKVSKTLILLRNVPKLGKQNLV